MRADYVLYKEKYNNTECWRVRFSWDDQSGKYLKSRSLGIVAEGRRERRREAERAAEMMLEGKASDANAPFLPYLRAFWSEGSDYIVEQADVNKTPLSKAYIAHNQIQIRLHISPCPLFDGLTLAGVSRKIIRAYKLWAAKQKMSGRLINQCLQTMRVAVRYAVANGELPADPFYGAGKAYHEEKGKGVLTLEERDMLIHSEATDLYARLSVLLALLCGLRLGEVRGLRWGDFEDGVINVCHNWVDGDGAEGPKRKGGTVQIKSRKVPMHSAVAALLNKIAATTHTEPDGFVIQSVKCKGKPVTAGYFVHAVNRELTAVGIPGKWPHKKMQDKPAGYVDLQKRRNLTFHSLRHSFVTHGRLAKIADAEMQALAGHGPKMMERYSHVPEVIDLMAAKEKLEAPMLPAPIQKTEEPEKIACCLNCNLVIGPLPPGIAGDISCSKCGSPVSWLTKTVGWKPPSTNPQENPSQQRLPGVEYAGKG